MLTVRQTNTQTNTTENNTTLDLYGGGKIKQITSSGLRNYLCIDAQWAHVADLCQNNKLYVFFFLFILLHFVVREMGLKMRNAVVFNILATTWRFI